MQSGWRYFEGVTLLETYFAPISMGFWHLEHIGVCMWWIRRVYRLMFVVCPSTYRDTSASILLLF